jgi:hypothetical protein
LFHPFSLQDSWNNHLIKNDTHFPWLSFALSPKKQFFPSNSCR